MRSLLSQTSFLAYSLLPLTTFSAVCAAPQPVQTVTYGATPSTGASLMSVDSSTSLFDGAKFPKTGLNSTAFDWWYFDAVSSTNDKQNVVVQFLTGNPSTLGLDGADGSFFNWILLSGTYANGTGWDNLIPAATGVVETSASEGWSKGQWTGSNCSWSGTFDHRTGMYSYDVTVGVAGMSGTLKMQGFTQPHYAHSLFDPSVRPKNPTSELLRPDFGWANAIPAGKASADFTVASERVQFTGWGYHDKNWGDKPTPQQTYSWYWGHAQMQDLSLVWFDYTSRDIPGNNPTSVYLVQQDKYGRNNVISLNTCTVRPYGKGVTFPPKKPIVVAEGYTIDVDAGSKGKWKFTARITTNASDPTPGLFYSRFTGVVEGGPVGKDGIVAKKDMRKGNGLWEWMYFLS